MENLVKKLLHTGNEHDVELIFYMLKNKNIDYFEYINNIIPINVIISNEVAMIRRNSGEEFTHYFGCIIKTVEFTKDKDVIEKALKNSLRRLHESYAIYYVPEVKVSKKEKENLKSIFNLKEISHQDYLNLLKSVI